MKIITSKFFRPRKCKYGDFELILEEGWKLSQTFIDYESKLLVASISCEDKSKWTDNGSSWSIPTKEFKIDLNTLKILEYSDWKNYFNYDEIEIISADKRYKLVIQRTYEPDNDSDGIKQKLYEIKSNLLICSSDSIAFSEEKRENLLESFYRSHQEIEIQKQILDSKPNLDEFYLNKLNELKENDVIVGYEDNLSRYKLVYLQNTFNLFVCNTIPLENADWETMKFVFVVNYTTLDDFWKDFAKDKHWFIKFKINQNISKKSLVLAKYIIRYFNNLRKEQNFTYNEYNQINEWQNSVWSDDYKTTELKQWCANCYQEVQFQGRYPKYICEKCASKETTDREGNLLVFSNVGFSGGFKIIRKNKNGHILEENDTEQFCDCIIDGKEFFAQEARFGGIVIQKKE